MKPLKFAAQMGAPKWRNDDSVTITLVTAQEVTDEKFLEISQHKKLNGWFIFSPNELGEADIPEANAPVEGEKSPSSELRSALWLLHQRKGGTKEAWPAFYQREMTRIKQRVLDALE